MSITTGAASNDGKWMAVGEISFDLDLERLTDLGYLLQKLEQIERSKKFIRVIDLASGKKIMETDTAHTHIISAIAFSADKRLLGSGSWDNTIDLWMLQPVEKLNE
jgi:WD40 repeat protein